MKATLSLIADTAVDLAVGLLFVIVTAILLAARVALVLPFRVIGTLLEPIDRWSSAHVLNVVDRALGPVKR